MYIWRICQWNESDLIANVPRSRSLSLFCLTGRTPASKEFVLLVLLVGSCPKGSWQRLGAGCVVWPATLENKISECKHLSWVECEDLQFIEFYSGFARTSLCMKTAGLRTAKCDYKYHYGGGNNFYDILTPAGFASLTQPVMSNWHQSGKILKYVVLLYTAATA